MSDQEIETMRELAYEGGCMAERILVKDEIEKLQAELSTLQKKYNDLGVKFDKELERWQERDADELNKRKALEALTIEQRRERIEFSNKMLEEVEKGKKLFDAYVRDNKVELSKRDAEIAKLKGELPEYKERVPEDYERVLFWNDSETIPFGICEIGYFVPSQSEITHWRPLPSPPTKDKTK